MSIEKKEKQGRGPNFTKEEQLVLLEALKSFTSIIESKKTDKIKNSTKQSAWRKVADIYNANTKGIPRSVENLIACYRNTKSKLKKQQSEVKMLLPDPEQENAMKIQQSEDKILLQYPEQDNAMKRQQMKRQSEAKILLQDPEQENELIVAIENNGKDWDAISKAISKPIELCQSSFEELKKKTIKEENRYKRKIMCTGGGPPSPNGDDNPLLKLKKFIDPQMDGLFTIYDADAELMEQFQSTKPPGERKRPIEISNVDFNKENRSVSLATSKHTDSQIDVESTSTSSRMDVIRKKKAPELDFSKDTPNPNHPNRNKKTTVNDSMITLTNEKLELVRLQKQQIEQDLKHRERMNELEYEDKVRENNFNEECRRKELFLLDLKINNIENS